MRKADSLKYSLRWGCRPNNLQVAMHADRGDACLLGHRARDPMRGAVRRLRVQRGVDQSGLLLVVNRTRHCQCVPRCKPTDAALHEPSAPFANGGLELRARREDASATRGCELDSALIGPHRRRISTVTAEPSVAAALN